MVDNAKSETPLMIDKPFVEMARSLTATGDITVEGHMLLSFHSVVNRVE